MSYHNLRRFFAATPQSGEASRQFDAWLSEAVSLPTSAARRQRLSQWSAAPAARQAHPREEHLAPLFVAAGAAGDDAARHDCRESLMGHYVSGFRFG